MTFTLDQLQEMRGSDVYSSDGEKIGVVDQVYLDQQTGQPEWMAVGTGFLRAKQAVVPLAGADVHEGGVTVPYGKDQVHDSPSIEGEQISQAAEAELYAHYGLEYSERRSDTGLPEDTPDSAMGAAEPSGEGESMTRHEEELHVGKESVETGRLRLHKWVETEPVQADVEVRQETARIEREPIEQPAADAELGEQEIEVPLRGERPVVEKETVAKERLTATKDVESETERVEDEVRKERVDTTEDAEAERR
jgi:uncharacterized protein (TIGR02271 family)